MPAYFHPQGEWTSVNKEARYLFAQEPDKAEVRVYDNAAQAMLEFTLGFREQFPLRKKYFYFKDLDPHFTPAATALAKAGLLVTALSRNALDDMEAFVNSVDREFGFIFFPLDHPLTGEIYPFEAFDKLLAEKGIPRLCASYQAGAHLPFASMDRNKALLVTLPASETGNRGLSLLASGERLRFGSAVAHTVTPRLKEELVAAAQKLEVARARLALKEKVLAFEAKRLADFEPLFTVDRSRHYDRVVGYWRDMDGHAFLAALAEEMGEPLRAPGKDPRFETASLSRWGGIRTMDWLAAQGLTREAIRGLVILSASLLTPEFENQFVRARARVLKDQNGE